MDIKSLNLDNGLIVKKIITKMDGSYKYKTILKPMLIFPKNHNYFIFSNFYYKTNIKIKRCGYDQNEIVYQGFERKLCEKYNDLFLKFNDGKNNFYINKERLSNIQQSGAYTEFYFADGKLIEIENIKEGTIDV